ncbi:hypothetical protein [Knoellia subterranea]|uniref:Uncharacterized protein n=1 Tax=Knoellia subterranea KCTC 19937 TaxID=1385521 RepID=A0A0A0JJQ8_9MICO|nr:hypothetical protein [Knoellia subterranea]KGN36287.1 hypothetical protein N803_05165 [Knoellia subterranea KCTC 19937]
MRSRRTIAYAVLAALVLGLAIVVGWATGPRTGGLDGQWEAEAVAGEVVGDRALVATDSNVAIDLVTGTRITLGSVTGGTKAIGGGRMLVLRDGTLDGAGLDGRSRWTWQGPPAHRLTLVAASPEATVVQACGGTPLACRLVGIGGNGAQSWTTPQPTGAGTAAPVVGGNGDLPTVGALPTEDGSLLLIDPATSRIVLRERATASVGRNGALVLDVSSGTGCHRTTYPTLDTPTSATTTGTCAQLDGASHDTTTLARRSQPWWWPFGNGRATLEVGGRHTGQVVGDDPLRTLRIDDDGLTVLEGDVVRRYAWVSGG